MCFFFVLNETKTSAINKPHKRKSINTGKKSKTFEVMEIWKCKFDKLKPTALSQKQTIKDEGKKRFVPGDRKEF